MTTSDIIISGLVTLLVALAAHLLTKSYMSDKYVDKGACTSCQKRQEKNDLLVRNFISDVREEFRQAFSDFKKDVKDWVQELK